MYNKRYYISFKNENNKQRTFGPYGSDAVGLRKEILERRYYVYDVKVISEEEYFEREREDFVNSTGATD